MYESLCVATYVVQLAWLVYTTLLYLYWLVHSPVSTLSWLVHTPGWYTLLVSTHSWLVHAPGQYTLLVSTKSSFTSVSAYNSLSHQLMYTAIITYVTHAVLIVSIYLYIVHKKCKIGVPFKVLTKQVGFYFIIFYIFPGISTDIFRACLPVPEE